MLYSLLYLNTISYRTSQLVRLLAICLIFFVGLTSLPVRADNKLDTDHPLISRFQGSERFSHFFFDYLSVDFPIGIIDNAKQPLNVLAAEGHASFITYSLPSSSSQLEVVSNIKHQLKQSDFTIVFECQQNSENNNCGKNMYRFTRSDRVQHGFQFSCGSDKQFYLVTAKLTRANHNNTYLYLCTEGSKLNQTIIEEKEINFNKIKIDSKNYQPSNDDLNGIMLSRKSDLEGTKDHPLISRFPNSVISAYGELDLGKGQLPLNAYESNDKNKVKLFSEKYYIAVEGKGTFIEYRLPDGLSQYQVIQNYLHALKVSNMEILFSCVGEEECGKGGLSDKSSVRFLMPGLAVGDNCSDSGALITAKMQIGENRHGYLFLCIDNSPWGTVSQTIIEEKQLVTGLVALSVMELENSIISKGKVAVYGVLFNSDSASILPVSTTVILQVAQLLTNKPQLKLYVVGHTDGQGEETYNEKLSKQRAQAIVNALINDHGIAKNRLQARGVGELVPVSTNHADEGRQLNRRVELVEM